MMKRLLALLAVVALAGACSSTPNNSSSPSADATASVSPSPVAVACTYPAEVAALLGTPEATATVADFVPLNAGVPDASLLPAGYVSPFAGQKFFFAPAADADDFRAGRDVATYPDALGNFTAGSAGGLVNSAIVTPASATSRPLSNLDGNTVIGELGVRSDSFDDVFAIENLDGLFAAPTAGGYARIGGIAVGADALYLEFTSTWVNTLVSEWAMPADFPILAIAHHPSAASAEAAVAWTESLGSAAKQIALCVNGVMTDFTVVDAAQMGIGSADLATRAQRADGTELLLAVAAVTVNDGHYVIARAVDLSSGKIALTAPLEFAEFQLALWPSGTKR